MNARQTCKNVLHNKIILVKNLFINRNAWKSKFSDLTDSYMCPISFKQWYKDALLFNIKSQFVRLESLKIQQ